MDAKKLQTMLDSLYARKAEIDARLVTLDNRAYAAGDNSGPAVHGKETELLRLEAKHITRLTCLLLDILI